MKSWIKSMIEAMIDVGSGFFLALLVQFTLIPLFFGIAFSGLQSVGIVTTFTTASIIRSTLWRKFFKNRYKNKTNKIIQTTGYCRVCKRK